MSFTCKSLPGAPPFRPLANQVLVKKLAPPERFDEKSPSGLLWVPRNAKKGQNDYSHRGLVVTVGASDKYRWRMRPGGSTEDLIFEAHPTGRFPMELEPGDEVFYERRPWGEFAWEKEWYVCLIETQHILAFHRPKPAGL